MKILAIDLGKFNSVCCFYNAKTRKAKFATTPTTREHSKVIFENCGADLFVMEACGPSGWINKTKNTIRAWFVNHGIEIDKGDKAWHTGRQ